ncbi:MAG: flagellar export protein FliJ [Proteobacteria bacterium]|nr:flagellar export protein FliJ [Pseudomonadota bacterium]MBU4471502.1 flagellar export protein FliJ [Pseudomonadota bacterium]MCG2752508.1 flagellar export protein FliJ [Desulfobacteraceae bacterium]
MYKFELDKILEIRKNIEDSIQYELNVIERQLKKEKEKHYELTLRRQNLSKTIETKLATGSSSKEYLLYADFISKINIDLENHLNEITEIERSREIKRNELINAVKNRKSLDNLKIKRTNEYLKMLQKIETNNFDDFASSQYTRRMEP